MGFRPQVCGIQQLALVAVPLAAAPSRSRGGGPPTGSRTPFRSPTCSQARSGSTAESARSPCRAKRAISPAPAGRCTSPPRSSTRSDQINETVLLSEASALVDEIADEDNGVVHASDALGSLLHAQLVGADGPAQLPDSERAGAAVRILAPLLAQHSCLRRSAHPPVRGKILSTPPPLDIATAPRTGR